MEGKTKISVLIVEDDTMLAEAVERKLKLLGFETKVFGSGTLAFEYLRSESSLPDVIWLDYYLKDMDGLAFMKRLKEDTRLSEVPVVVVSNSASAVKVKAMFELGVREYLVKAEHRIEEIAEVIKGFVNHSNGGVKDG